MSQKISYLTDVVLLTVVVQADKGETVLETARDLGATTGAFGFHAKGIGMRERLGLLGLAVEVEKQVINLLVSTNQQDIVVDQIYRAAKLNIPGMGYIYSTPLEKIATYLPESLKQRLEKSTPSSDTDDTREESA